jgi:hypothetical protein
MVTSTKISAQTETKKSEMACRTELNNHQMCIDYPIIAHGWSVWMILSIQTAPVLVNLADRLL